jgi:hypothetical protein
MTIVLQAEQSDFTFEGFAFELGVTVATTSASANYVTSGGAFYVTGGGDFYVTGSVVSYAKPIVLDAHLPDLVFEGWIHNG